MKQIFLFALAVIFTGQQAFSQGMVQINPFGGLSTSSALPLYYGKVRTASDWNFGGNISFGKGVSGGGFTQNAFIELQYNYLKTIVQYRSYDPGSSDVDLSNISMHNVMIGGTKESGNEKVVGYGGTYVGVTIFDPTDSQYNNQTRFTLAFGAGLKYAMNPKVGLRLHAQMYMPIWGSDFYVGWSPGGGTTTGIVASAVNVYANFNLGLYFNLGDRG